MDTSQARPQYRVYIKCARPFMYKCNTIVLSVCSFHLRKRSARVFNLFAYSFCSRVRSARVLILFACSFHSRIRFDRLFISFACSIFLCARSAHLIVLILLVCSFCSRVRSDRVFIFLTSDRSVYTCSCSFLSHVYFIPIVCSYSF